MEKVSTIQDEELLNYLDGQLTDDQARQLKMRLENSPVLVARLEELRAVTGMLEKRSSLIHPSSNFTHRVMTNLHRLPASAGLSPKNGLLLLCGILVAVGILGFLLANGVFDNMSRTIDVTKLPVTNDVISNPLPAVSFNGKWIINAIVILALGLSFVLLDRTILRPYFSRRSRLQF